MAVVHYAAMHMSFVYGRWFQDMERIRTLGEGLEKVASKSCDQGSGRVDATIGSALDIFGGKLPYDEVRNVVSSLSSVRL